jgi:hypothetical protein
MQHSSTISYRYDIVTLLVWVVNNEANTGDVVLIQFRHGVFNSPAPTMAELLSSTSTKRN